MKKIRLYGKVAHSFAVSTVVLMGALAYSISAGNQAGSNSQTELAAMPAETAITLKGVSKGGTLELASCSGKWPSGKRLWAIATNHPGDSAQVVASRLAKQLEEMGIKVRLMPTNEAAILILPGGGILSAEWLVGGTDIGFNLPAPPEAVSVSYDTDTDNVTVRWVNPSAGYDWVLIHYMGTYNRIAKLPGSSTSYTFRPYFIQSLHPEDLRVLVLGEKDGVVSSGGPVLFDKVGVQQRAVMDVPFVHGIAPGFEAWTYNLSAKAIAFQQGKALSSTGNGTSLDAPGFYQVVKSYGPGCGGLLRRFIGLKPGQVYRVSARLNVFEARGDGWAFSFHAAPNPPARKQLSIRQLAGLDELPTGAKGPKAAQIARCDSTRYTAGQWVKVSSGVKAPDNVAGDIALPEGCDSITVWFRLEGKDADDVAVGFDSLTIEDLGKR